MIANFQEEEEEFSTAIIVEMFSSTSSSRIITIWQWGCLTDNKKMTSSSSSSALLSFAVTFPPHCLSNRDAFLSALFLLFHDVQLKYVAYFFNVVVFAVVKKSGGNQMTQRATIEITWRNGSHADGKKRSNSEMDRAIDRWPRCDDGRLQCNQLVISWRRFSPIKDRSENWE